MNYLLLKQYFINIILIKNEIISATLETITMVLISTFFSVLFGGIIGFTIFISNKKQLKENLVLYNILNQLTNFIRSIPFIILIILLMPITRFFLGTTIGSFAVAFSLSFGGTFYFARLIEQNLKEVPKNIIEAAQTLGASNYTIIFKILLSESRSGVILSITILAISLLSYSAAAGMIGGGGLGDLAIRYGYYRYQTEIIIFISLLLALMVITMQSIGNYISKKQKKFS